MADAIRTRSQRAKVAGALAIAALLLAGGAASASAQETFVSAFGGFYTDLDTVEDGESGTTWEFGTGFGGGIGIQRRFGQSLLAGVEASYAPIDHEVRQGTDLLDEGRAHLVTALLTGQLGAGGGGGFFTYLAGGIGTMIYGIPHLDRWDGDLALRGGGGVQYDFSSSTAAYLQWNRWWVFHSGEGVDDSRGNHSLLQLGLRYGI